jgi:hypothetical protein
MILKHKATGDLFVEETVSNFNQCGSLDGTQYSILYPVIRYVKNAKTYVNEQSMRRHEAAGYNLTLIVTKAVLAAEFEQVKDMYAVQNMDIDEYIAGHKQDGCCDYSDENIIAIAAKALREVGGMGDSGIRAGYYTLANYVLKHTRAK